MGKFRKAAALLLILVLVLTGCSSGTGRTLPEGAEPFPIPPFRDAVFHADAAEIQGNLRFDCSELSEGYVAVQVTGGGSYKFQIEKDDMRYHYDIIGDDTPVILPLNMENGSYTFRFLENVGDGKYACLWSDSGDVAMPDEFAPYLIPSQMVSYREDSKCVALARELAGECQTDSEVASKIYKYLVKHISYDEEKAATVQSGYLPSPDRTLAEGKGICFDYASLAAAMMRSLGIPCKLIMGYVDGTIYHAWNSFYLQEQGWVTVEIKAKPGLWQRVDITMAASGTPASQLEDDGKYTTRYTY